MGAISLVIMVVACGSLLTGDDVTDYDIRQPPKGKHHAIFQIIGNRGGRGYTCSAFAISDTQAITAGHCIDELYKQLIVRNSYGQDTGVRAKAVSKRDNKRDYALLTGNFKDFEKFPITKDFVIRRGSHYRSCGFAGGKLPPICTDFTAVGSWNFYYGGMGYFVKGMSGGPLVDKNGFAVGIISHVSGQHVYVTPLVGILDFKQEIPKAN